MKFYGGLVIAIIALVLLLLWLKDNSENAPTTTVANATTPVGALTPVPTAAAAYPPAVPAPTPATYVAGSTPYSNARPAAAFTGPSAGCQALAPAAQRARVNVVSCLEQGGYTVITVWGSDRNNLNDFLDEAMRAGVRDVAPAQRYAQSVVQGRIRFQNTFRFRF